MEPEGETKWNYKSKEHGLRSRKVAGEVQEVEGEGTGLAKRINERK